MNSFTTTFIFFQIIVLSLLSSYLWLNKTWYTHTNTAASIVTIFGVFGTFLGIVIGLDGFQAAPDKIQESIKELLKGLRLAFWTSLVGIGSALGLKIIALVYQTLKPDEDPGEKAISKTDELLNSIRVSLSGANGGTLFTELQALQKTVENNNRQWIKEFSAFSERVVEDCTGLLVEALEAVVQDYNAKINEQFGENFVKLNEAVLEINRWQEQYRQQMDELATEFRIAAESVEQSRESLESAAESLTLIGGQSKNIVSITEVLDPILQNLNDRLEDFRLLRQQALDAFPQINKGLDDLTSTFSSSVEKSIADSEQSLLNQRSAMAEHVRQIRSALETTTQQLTKVTKPFSETTEKIKNLWDTDLKRSTDLDNIIQVLARSAERLEGHLNHLDTLSERLNKRRWFGS